MSEYNPIQPVHHHDEAQQAVERLRSDEGSAPARVAMKLGVSVLATTVALGAVGSVVAGAAGLNWRLKHTSGSEAFNAEAIDVSSINWQVNALTTYAVGGRIDTNMSILGVNIPGTGNGARFVSSDTSKIDTGGKKTDPRSKVIISSGFGTLKSNPDGGTITTDVITENNVKKEIVTIPIGPKHSALIANAQFSEGDGRIEKVNASHEFTMFVEGISGVAGAPVQLVCHASTGVVGKLSNKKSPEICQNLDPQKIFGFLRNDAIIQQRLRYDTLKAVQQQCAPLQWDLESKAIIKSIVDASVQKGWKEENVVVKFVGDDNQPTTAAPDYTRSAMDDLVARGILLSAPSGAAISMESSGITCQKPQDGVLQP